MKTSWDRCLGSIEYLDLSYNLFTVLPIDIFANMKSLRLLQLQHNRHLRSVLPAVWTPVVNLQLLVAHNCAMKYIDGFNRLYSLSSVWLSGNPLICTCETVPFLERLGSNITLDATHMSYRGQKFRFKKELTIESASECRIEDNSYKSTRQLKDIQGQIQSVFRSSVIR